MFTKETFCSLPWSSIQINSTGDYKICCFSGAPEFDDDIMVERNKDHGMAYDENGNIMNVLTHSILEAINSENHKKLRIAQSNNEKSPMCKVCWDREDANAKRGYPPTSLRVKRTFGQFPQIENAITLNKVNFYANKNGILNEMPISLDLRFTNKCNMKCIMCSSKYSSLWYEDEMKLYDRDYMSMGKKQYKLYQENGVYKADIPVWHDSPIWWQRFDEIKHRVKHIYLTGGEPFIIKGHDTLLDKLIESNLAKNVIMEYDTNLTVINDKLLEKLKKFKQVLLFLSCDDIGDRFEHIRFPGKFDVFTNNLKKLEDRNIHVTHISSCIGLYSIFSPIRVEEYFKNLGYDRFSFRLLRTDPYDIAYLPDELKKKVIDIYEKSNISERWKGFVCGYLENNMNKYEKSSTQYLNRFVEHMNKLDLIRGTDWKNTFPEIYDLLNVYINT
jgi:MoaA/NifB/PqqE/SkfB family radical SAM enzyme